MESRYTGQRKLNIFSPGSSKPYKLSRFRIENFLRCQRCFYLDRKLGIDQPPMFPYTLNNAVDALLKDEFDLYRLIGKPHPYLVENGIDALPFPHKKINDWRMSQRGITYHHTASNFLVQGVIDDVWINPQGELILVDYKATSTSKEVSLNNRDSYKRQMEIYQWLFRQNGFPVSNIGYFVYCNGDAERGHFADALKFKVTLLPYKGDDSWVEDTLLDIKALLMNDKLPSSSDSCDHCSYVQAISKHTLL